MLARKALAGTAAAPKEYVEDVFSTYLYTGTGSAQTITNNIDLSGEGGLVWLKKRSAVSNHWLLDTIRGGGKPLNSNTTNAEPGTTQDMITSFNSNGFSLGTEDVNDSSATYASWTFRKAKKFFDVVTYTGNGSNRTISHNLGSVPGSIFIKRTDTTAAWAVYHRSLANTEYLVLNTTAAKATGATYWNSTTPTSTVFSLGTSTDVNANNGTYVAYLFAHDAGGFGDAGDQNVISCGSVTANGSGAVAETNLGWEPQWVLYKRTDSTSNWFLFDTMRGLVTGTDPTSTNNKALYPNLSDAEINSGSLFQPLATGFAAETAAANSTWIYIAIRRGPMKTPEAGTEVFSPVAYSGDSTANRVLTTNFAPDAVIISKRSSSVKEFVSSLTGYRELLTTGTDEEYAYSAIKTASTGLSVSNTGHFNMAVNTSGETYIAEVLRRAPGFFDVVCYTGNGSYGRTISHNLGVAPELLIVKQRSLARGWAVYAAPLGATEVLQLHLSDAKSTSDWFANTTPTSSVFSVGSNQIVNENSQTFVAYLFASVTGVSKVGSYTGNGSSVTVTTGFQPRFILVKRTDSTGNWIVSDSARGLVAGNDPYLLLNSTAAEDTDEDWVDVSSTGFTVNQVTASNANVNTGSYIYLAIA